MRSFCILNIVLSLIVDARKMFSQKLLFCIHVKFLDLFISNVFQTTVNF